VGSVSDPLASQGSLTYDRQANLLFAVNAGSNSISVFRVQRDSLALTQVVESNGEFPVSIAFHGASVVVLNGGGAANVSGFRIKDGRLHPVPDDTRSLGLTESDPPAFLQSPAEVGFTPSGRQLIVTGKTNNFVDVFSVGPAGRLSASPTRTDDASVPFAFAFSPGDQLDLVNAAGNVAPSHVRGDGMIAPDGPAVADGQTAACWIALAGDHGFVANTGSNDVSAYRIGDNGHVSLIDATAATGIMGATDETTSDGRFLYVLSSLTSSVKVYAIHGSALTLLQTVGVPDGASEEGIASTSAVQ
jgi:6-phosphogluconolactonase (cycloisomerase 2 family)